jgi:Ca2+-transporting ATPase
MYLTNKNWHALEAEEIMHVLRTSKNGLSTIEAKERLKKFGYNLIYERKKRLIEIFIRQFKSFLVAILLIAVVISAAIGNFLDAAIILFILILNAFLGFFQEYKAERALEELKELTSPKAVVIRDGRKTEIHAKELVPGDIIFIEAGKKIPADARLIEEFSLMVDESSLTGESIPVHKTTKKSQDSERSNMIFMGTTATYGRGLAVVVNTGMNTEIGKIAKIVQEEKEFTPLQK